MKDGVKCKKNGQTWADLNSTYNEGTPIAFINLEKLYNTQVAVPEL